MSFASNMQYSRFADGVARRDSRISQAVPEDAVLQPGDTGSMHPQGSSPFEQAVPYMSQYNLEATYSSSKPKKKGLAGMFSCACFGSGGRSFDAVDRIDTAYNYPAGDVPGLEEPQVSTVGPLPGKAVSRRLSGHKTWGHVPHDEPRQATRQNSLYSDTDWFDAMSQLSGSHSGEQDDLETLEAQLQAQMQPSHGAAGLTDSALRVRRSPSCGKAPWIPDQPLIFAPADIQFVPVPKATGFAAYWENDMTRTTPHPQPIDVMIKASFIVRQVHKSIPGLWVQENDGVVTVVAKPKFVPPGYQAYMEVYDKSNAVEPVWSPRRDMNWGTCSGRVYMTADGMLILRCACRPVFGKDIEFITEDYLVLEQGGQVVVDRMCCLEVATGRKAVQYQVGLRRDKPPFGWGAGITPHFKPDRILDDAHKEKPQQH